MSSDGSSFLFLRNRNPYGKSWENWAALWCSWLLAIPRQKNPSLDETGEHCAENQIDPNVWFLAGTFGNVNLIRRKCIVPLGKAIFFPILEKEDSFAEDVDLRSELELASRAEEAMNKVITLRVDIDGVLLSDIANYRVRSNFFDLNFPVDNVYDVRQGSTRSICDGYWIFIKPLPAGEHVIHFFGECLVPKGEKATEQIKNASVYSKIRGFAETYQIFKIEVDYEIIIE